MTPESPEPDGPSFDPAHLVATFRLARVEFLVVGGLAGLAYGGTRRTGDFDIIPRRSPDNAHRLADELVGLHARVRVQGLSDADARTLPWLVDADAILRQGDTLTLMTDAGPLDLLVGLRDREGVVHDYDALRAGAVEVPAPGGGLVWAAALEAIIESKEVADRPKDHEALPELRAIRDGTG